jgi:DNA-binding MarR family transcriptional regulator
MNHQIITTERLLLLLNRLKNLSLRRPHLDNVALSFPQIGLLDWIAQSPGCGVLDIAKGLGLAPPTISVGVRRLEKEGWLARQKHPEDRRVCKLYLTTRGEELIHRVWQHRDYAIQQFLSGLDEQEQEQLLDLLEKAISRAEENNLNL